MFSRLALGLSLVGATLCFADGNLLRNGGFEEGLAPWDVSFGNAACVRIADTGAQSGGRCVRIVCREQNSGVDFPRFQIGRQVARTGTYRLRAALRNGGIQAGDFGLRLYFHSGAGEVLAMYGGIGVRGEQPGDWQTGEIEFGRGTKYPIPPAAATMLVRFSMWAPGAGATGTAWLDSASLEQTASMSRVDRAQPIAWIWQDAGEDPRADQLAERIAKGGFAIERRTGRELSAPGVLRAGNLDLLVLPQGGRYPVLLADALSAFFLDGGALLVLGGVPFAEPVFATPAGPRGMRAAVQDLARIAPDAPWNERQAGADDRVLVAPAAGGWRFDFDLKGFAYAGTPLAPLASEDAVLELEVRGDGETPRLCVEFHEQDGSRWKRIVPVAEEWTAHRLHLGEFVAYASEGRGGKEDWLRGDRLKQLAVGFTRTMVGQGTRRVELRNVRLLKAEIPSRTVAGAKRFLPGDLSVVRWFGEQHASESMVVPSPVVVRGGRQRRDALRRSGEGAAIRGDWQAWELAMDPPPPPRKGGKRLPLDRVLALASGSLRVPLLQAENSEADRIACAGLFVHADGEYAGSRWAVFALELPGAAPAVVGEAVTDAARALASAGFTHGPRPVFRVADGKVAMDVAMPIANPSPADLRLKLELRIAGQATAVHEIAIPARQAAVVDYQLATGLPAPPLETAGLDLAVEIREASGPLYGPRVFRLDLREQLRAVCDFMVEQARDDGKLHGYSFIDNRGMRALLGAYEILGDPRYLETALRWGEIMVREQREDGGYRMGYGITRKGEECYVADGGEIVVGILRLASYCKGEQRERFLASADRYMGYREDFRVETGGIGVGWCLQDYGKRPITPLDTPTRIYSPENNTYTIGCSLAGAYAHAAIRGTPELERRAEQDADWLMARATRLNGAFVESFFFAHAFATTPERKAIYAEYIARVFVRAMADSHTTHDWWLSGGGRSALNLDGLAYAIHRLGAGPEVRAGMYRALCAMYSPQASRSIPVVIAGDSFDHDRWIYICFGTLGLVDVLKPMVSIDGFAPR